MILTGPAGDTIQNAVTVKRQAGLDSYAAKLMFGDWLWWSDQVNSTIRLVSPQGFAAGRLANLSPEQSSLNKQLYSVIGSQKSGTPGSSQSASYSSADLAVLLGAGIDVISNPQPGGNFWGVRGGHNSSSNAAVNGDNYTRLTNYIAATLAAGMGQYVGQVINADLFRRIRATQLSFLQNMLGQGLLGSTDGSLPFSVICDTSNNPFSRTDLGYVQSDAQVQYQAINEKFIINHGGRPDGAGVPPDFAQWPGGVRSEQNVSDHVLCRPRYPVGRDRPGGTHRSDPCHVVRKPPDHPFGPGGPAGRHAHGHRTAQGLGGQLRARTRQLRASMTSSPPPNSSISTATASPPARCISMSPRRTVPPRPTSMTT